VLLVDCLLLGLLIIVQLPKKEAGIGMAFGGSATDALFGAGSGNTLTKLTKYTAGIFFVLVLVLNILNIRAKPGSEFENQFNKAAIPAQAPAPASPAAPAPAADVPAPTGLTAPTNLPNLDSLNATNAPPTLAPASNAPGK
jgi:protein translocase SecG subunit